MLHFKESESDALAADIIGSQAKSLPADTDVSIEKFFLRNGYDPVTKEICDAFALDRFPGAGIELSLRQGYCSYTLAIGSNQILQFRPSAFKIDTAIVIEAREALGDVVPCTRLIGVVHGVSLRDGDLSCSDELYVYLLDRIHGVSLEEVQGYVHDIKRLFEISQSLSRDLGAIFATTFLVRKRLITRIPQASKGKVGGSLSHRLQMLQEFDSKDVKAAVDEVQDALDDIERLPWCMTHGDMVPANILVDPSTGTLKGLIDWAEGEYLPFGVGLYGLEEVLGATRGGRFEYNPEHEALREEFWNSFRNSLHNQGHTIKEREWERILLARKLGILLWRGIAFENGKIDRVVEPGVDDSELQKLHLFLDVQNPVPLERCHGRGRARNWFRELLKVSLQSCVWCTATRTWAQAIEISRRLSRWSKNLRTTS